MCGDFAAFRHCMVVISLADMKKVKVRIFISYEFSFSYSFLQKMTNTIELYSISYY